MLTMEVDGTKSDDELRDSGDEIESDKDTHETINTQRSKDTNIDSDSSNDDKSESESENSEVDMFEDDSLGGNDRVSKEFEIKKWLEKTDIELFEMDANVPECVRNSQRYTKRRNNFVKNYIDEQKFQNSQDIL